MASTFLRVFAVMLALTGFSAASATGAASASGSNGGYTTMDQGGGSGVSGGPICTTATGSCGLD